MRTTPSAETPSPILLPVNNDYAAWSRDYSTYISGHFNYYLWVSLFVGAGQGTQLYYAPFAPKESNPANPLYSAALTAYQKAQIYLDANDAWNGTINLADGDPADGKTPGGGKADISKDPYYQPLVAPALKQTDQYYVNYQKYITEFGDNDGNIGWSSSFVTANDTTGFLAYNPTKQVAPQPGRITPLTPRPTRVGWKRPSRSSRHRRRPRRPSCCPSRTTMRPGRTITAPTSRGTSITTCG